MAFCSHCGTPLDEGAGFCTNCGARAGGITGARETSAQAEDPYAPPPRYAIDAYSRNVRPAADSYAPPRYASNAAGQNGNSPAGLFLAAAVIYTIPGVISFLINITGSYGFPYPYVINNILFFIGYILAICGCVKLKGRIASPVRNAVIVLLIVDAIPQLYYFMRYFPAL
jgi:hypothetical protein